MKFVRRAYQNEEDFWRIRNFLRKVFLLNDRHERSWHVARLDYWRWHFIKNCQSCDACDRVTTIWETVDREIVAVLHPQFMGEAYLQVHPGFRTEALEDEMFSLAEEHLAVQGSDGQRKLFVAAEEDDELRHQVLLRRGYQKREHLIHRWSRDLNESLVEVQVPPGYTVRSMGGPEEYPARSWASWRAFHPDAPDEEYEGWEWYHSIQESPLYRRDLDIVAATETGEITSFGTLWFDDFTRSACFVLVGTVPEHQRRGVGTAVLAEGLRRLQQMGGTKALANGYDPPANALYAATLGRSTTATGWQKILSSVK